MDYYNNSNLHNDNLKNDNNLNLYLKIPKYFPRYKVIYYFLIIIKFLPLIVFTHDWNINSKLGISFWIRKFTLAELIFDVDHIEIYYILVIILFILFLIVCLFFIIIKKKMRYNGKLFHLYRKQICFCSFSIFYIFYAIPQFYFSVFIENIFNKNSKKQNKIIYYLIIILEGIIMIYTFIISFFMGSIIIHEPFFINSLSPILNEIGTVDILPFFILFTQIVVQLEFSIDFKYIFLIKAILRGIFCFYSFKSFFNFNTFYYKYRFYYIYRLLLNCCFVSCIIEYIFIYDYNNKLKILQKDNAIIVFKLIVEIIFSIVLNEIYFYFDNKKIKEQVILFSFKNIETFNNKMIKFLNMLYYQQRPNILKSILQELNISIANRIHSPICKERKGFDKCFYCHIYSPQKFTSEMNFFINFIKDKNELDYNCMKINFPLLFCFFENEINHYNEINILNKKSVFALFFIVTYIYIYERNYYKCLFILEKIQSSDFIQNSYLSKYQITFFKYKLLHFYKNQLNNKCGNIHQINISEKEHSHRKKVLKSFKNFKCIERIYNVERVYMQFLLNYIKLMNCFNDDITCFYVFKYYMENYINNYYNLHDITNKLFNTSKFNFVYPVNKLKMFFYYFRNKIPKRINSAFEKFFIEQSSSFIERNVNFFVIILQIYFLKKDIAFKLNYVSDNLIQKLRYTNNEFNSLHFNEIFAKTFYKSYKYIFEKNIQEGSEFFKLNNLCLIDKNKYVISFDMEGVPIYKKNKIELYIKLNEAKEQLLTNKNYTLSNKNIRNQKTNNNNFCGGCFLFTNKSGKIYNLGRGFEEYFFLNTNVLERYNINIMELLKIEKLESKGIIKKNLLNIYNNIYDIYLREVGQIGEDAFSQVIIQINEIKKNISFYKNSFIVDINYEEKSICKEGKKIKNYYLFVLTINLEAKENFQSTEIIQMFQQQTSFLNQTDLGNEININLNNELSNQNKEYSNFIYSKLMKIKILSKIIVQKFHKIKVKLKNEEFIEEEKEKNNDTSKQEEIQNEDIKLLQLKKKKKQKEYKTFFLLKLIPGIIIICFIICFFLLYHEKMIRFNKIKSYFKAIGDGLMLSHTSIQIIIKVLEIQLKNNNLQPDILNYYYNNSFDYHIETLNNRIKDYLTFKIQFTHFYYSFIYLNKISDLFFLTPQNYTISDINGTKTIQMVESIMTFLNIITSDIIKSERVVILYNNSEYYFNDSMIENTEISKSNYYNSAQPFILIIDNFAKCYLFYYSELLNSVLLKVNDQIDLQFTISKYNIISSGVYVFFMITLFFIFLKKTQKSIIITFKCYITIRFFNNYIIRKTIIILDFFDNYSENNNHKQILNNLEIINDNEETNLINQIISDSIYDYKTIRIKPYSIKFINYTHNHKNYILHSTIKNSENIDSEIKKSFMELNSFSSNIKSKNNNTNNINTLLRKPKTNFAIKNNELNRSSIEIGFSNIESISITKQLISSYSSSTNNIINPINQNSLNNNSNNINTGTNNTLNTNSTNLNNNEISLSKSNIPLNDNTNRTKNSSLKLLNQIDNNKKNNKRKSIQEYKDHKNEKKMKYIQRGYKLLDKPFLYFFFFMELIFLQVIFIILSIIEIIISNSNNNMFKSIIETRNDIFQQFNLVAEMYIIYILSILTNKEIKITFFGNDLSYSCKDALKLKNDNDKNVFNYINICYPLIKENVDKILLGKINSNLKQTTKFHLKINSVNFCEIYSEFLYNNRFDSSIPDLSYLQNNSLEDFYNECYYIGNSYNSKGLTIAFESIVQVIQNEYKDFINDLNKTNEEKNYIRLNNEYIGNIQIEIERILRKVILCYYIVFYWDYESIEKTIIRNISLVYSFIGLIILITMILYIYNVHIFSRDLKKIQFFFDCIKNTILFL